MVVKKPTQVKHFSYSGKNLAPEIMQSGLITKTYTVRILDFFNQFDYQTLLDNSIHQLYTPCCGYANFDVIAMNRQKNSLHKLLHSHFPRTSWPIGLVVYFSLRVGEVPNSTPGRPNNTLIRLSKSQHSPLRR